MIRWEYKTVSVPTHGWMGGIVKAEELDAILNQFGQEGWELVSALDTNMDRGQTRFIVAIFKRQIS